MSTATALTLADAARMMQQLSPVDRSRLRGLLGSEDMRDKSYQLLPIGQEAAEYLGQKRKRLTDGSYRKYEGALDKLARHFTHLDGLTDLEPPVGTSRVEEFMTVQWGDSEPRTYNSNLSVVRDFFQWAVKRGKLQGDPTLLIERAKARGVYRTTFSADQRRAILADNPDQRDRLCLRLLLDYALRKGSVRSVQFQHFDHVRKRLTIFAKGGKVRNVPIPDPAFWHDLERLILDTGAEPHWYLMPTTRGNRQSRRLIHTEPSGNHRLHKWWYRCLANAGIVPVGTEKGERMHKARHSAGQRLLDHTGNLKAVQQLLGHETIATTADVYVGWDETALAMSLESALEAERRTDEKEGL